MLTAESQLLRGLNSSKMSRLLDNNTLHDCLNFEPSTLIDGQLIQSPYWRTALTATQTDYYSGGTVTEGTSVPVLGTVGLSSDKVYTITTQTVKRETTTGVQVFYQTTISAPTIYKSCLLRIVNVTALAVNLGSTLEVEMTGAAAFRWRKNGGGWTAGVPSTAGVSIDGGNATLYFMANTGFAGTETFKWTRTDRATESSGSLNNRQIVGLNINSDIYFITSDYRVMRLTPSDSIPVCVSAGYHQIYGIHLNNFQNHLVVTGYSLARPSTAALSISKITAWSDLNDFDSFVSTDTNEADQKIFPDVETCIGSITVQQQLFVITTDGIFVTSYLGLPLVFSFDRAFDFDLYYSTQSNQIIDGKDETWIISPYEFWRFNGNAPVLSSVPVRRHLSTYSGSVIPVCGHYDKRLKRYYILVVTSGVLLCYDTLTNFWYRRNVSFAAAPYSINTVFPHGGNPSITIGCASRQLQQDILTWDTYTPLADVSTGASYTSPTVTLQILQYDLQQVFELIGSYLGIATTTVGGTTLFSTGAYLQAKLYWYTSQVGLVEGAASTASDAIWTNASSDGTFSHPRISVRSIALEVRISGTNGSLPPGYCSIYNLVETIRKGNVTR